MHVDIGLFGTILILLGVLLSLVSLKFSRIFYLVVILVIVGWICVLISL